MKPPSDADALRRLLYLEDDPNLRELVTDLLQEYGEYEVDAYPDVASALVSAAGHRPQLLLADFELAGMDGLTAWRVLRQQPLLSELPVVFITGRAHHRQLVESCLAAGALGVLPKPIDPWDLVNSLRTLWASRAPSDPCQCR
jgi:CheY-like chemotaxis protein